MENSPLASSVVVSVRLCSSASKLGVNYSSNADCEAEVRLAAGVINGLDRITIPLSFW